MFQLAVVDYDQNTITFAIEATFKSETVTLQSDLYNNQVRFIK